MKKKAICLILAILIIIPCLQIEAFQKEADIQANINDEMLAAVNVDEATPTEPTQVDNTQNQTSSAATEAENKEMNEASSQTDSATAGTQNPVINTENKTGIGQVDVSILSALLLEKSVHFTVSLTGQEVKSIDLPGDSDAGLQTVQQGVSFENLEPGDYVLTVTAPGFAKYTQ